MSSRFSFHFPVSILPLDIAFSGLTFLPPGEGEPYLSTFFRCEGEPFSGTDRAFFLFWFLTLRFSPEENLKTVLHFFSPLLGLGGKHKKIWARA